MFKLYIYTYSFPQIQDPNRALIYHGLRLSKIGFGKWALHCLGPVAISISLILAIVY